MTTMTFIVSASSLLKHLQLINGVIATNTVLPILEDFLFVTNGNRLQVVATDLETVMKVELDVESKTDAKVCIPARMLMDSLKNLPDQPLTFTVDDNFGIEITSDSGKYKMMGENPDGFPKDPELRTSTSFEIESSAFIGGINKTLFAVSNDELRPAMTGVFFELDKKSIQMVATDAHRLIRYRRTDVQAPKADSFVVPKKPLALLKNALKDDGSLITVSYNSNHFFVSQNDITLSCRLIDARFPDYKVVIPSESPYTLKVNRSDFQSALKRVSVFSNKSTSLVVLKITGSELHLDARDIDFSNEGNETMACTYNGEDMQIAFNGRFLIDVLNAPASEEILFELSTPTRAGIIRPSTREESEDLLMILMPLMISN
jgi:DNA polymerase-3 subunit beta